MEFTEEHKAALKGIAYAAIGAMIAIWFMQRVG